MSNQQQGYSQPPCRSTPSSPGTKGKFACGICGLNLPAAGEVARHVKGVHNVVQYMCDHHVCMELSTTHETCMAKRQNSSAVNGRGPDGRPASGRRGREEHHRHCFTEDDRKGWYPQPETNQGMYAVFPCLKRWQTLARENPFGLGETEEAEAKRKAKNKKKESGDAEYLNKLKIDREMYAARDRAALEVSGGMNWQPQQESTSSGSSFFQESGAKGIHSTPMASMNTSQSRHSYTAAPGMENGQHPPGSFPPSAAAFPGGQSRCNFGASPERINDGFNLRDGSADVWLGFDTAVNSLPRNDFGFPPAPTSFSHPEPPTDALHRLHFGFDAEESLGMPNMPYNTENNFSWQQPIGGMGSDHLSGTGLPALTQPLTLTYQPPPSNTPHGWQSGFDAGATSGMSNASFDLGSGEPAQSSRAEIPELDHAPWDFGFNMQLPLADVPMPPPQGLPFNQPLHNAEGASGLMTGVFDLEDISPMSQAEFQAWANDWDPALG